MRFLGNCLELNLKVILHIGDHDEIHFSQRGSDAT
jgi:hypothetical protein